MNKKRKLKKICYYCKIHYEVAPNRKHQKYCSRECASHSVRIPANKLDKNLRPVGSNYSKNRAAYHKDLNEQKKRFKYSPFHKTSEEVALAVQAFLASGGEITTMPSPSATKAAATKEESDSELVKEITKPLSRDRSVW